MKNGIDNSKTNYYKNKLKEYFMLDVQRNELANYIEYNLRICIDY